MKKIVILNIILIILLFGISIYFYSQLPDRIVSHWDAHGNPNGSMGKFFGIFLIPLITLGIFLLFLVIPLIDPLKDNIKKFMNYYQGFIFSMILFLSLIQVHLILWNIGIEVPTNFIIPLGVGVLFIFIGVLIKHSKRNWFIGIRTPWTLSSDKVWDETHRVGSKLFILSGIISLVGLFFPNYVFWFILIPVLFTALFCVVYSYLVWKKIIKK